MGNPITGFVPCCQTPPPENRSILVEQGGSYFFAAYNRFMGWRALENGRERAMEGPPTSWLPDDDQADSPQQPAPPLMFAPRRGQLLLDLSDSNSQSQGQRAA